MTRNRTLHSLYLALAITLASVFILSGTEQSANASVSNISIEAPIANHCTCLHNATQKKDVTAWGVWSYISWTNPNLNNGTASYHRVGIVQNSPWRFVEFGWVKTILFGNCDWNSTFCGLVSYNAGSGGRNVAIPSVTQALHRYSMQYDPNTSKYWFYVDGTNVYSVNANFSSGNFVVGGGEVSNGLEKMNGTTLSDLRYIASLGGSYVSRNGHTNYVVEAPYYNTNISSNSFSDNP
jgi:hypothetical protein